MGWELSGEVREIFGSRRFCEESIGAELADAAHGGWIVRSRQDDDEELFAGVMGANSGEDVEPGRVRQFKVKEHDGGKGERIAIAISAFAGQVNDGFGPGLSPMDRVGQASVFGCAFEKEGIVGRVFDQEEQVLHEQVLHEQDRTEVKVKGNEPQPGAHRTSVQRRNIGRDNRGTVEVR